MPDNETAVAEVPVTENPPAETTAQLAAQVPVDDVAQLRALNAKLENELRTLKGFQRKGFKQEAAISSIRDEVAALKESMTALVTEMSSDPDAPNRIAAIEARQQERREASKKTTEAQAQAIYHDVAEEVAEAHGVDLKHDSQKVREILQNDSTWAEVREMVLDAWETQDLEGLKEAARKAAQVRRSFQDKKDQARTEEAVAKARREEQAKTKEVLKESGALGMPHGGAVGMGGGTHDGYLQRLKKGTPLPSPEEIDRIVAERMKRQ